MKELYEVIMGFNVYTNGIEANDDVVTSSFWVFIFLKEEGTEHSLPPLLCTRRYL